MKLRDVYLLDLILIIPVALLPPRITAFKFPFTILLLGIRKYHDCPIRYGFNQSTYTSLTEI